MGSGFVRIVGKAGGKERDLVWTMSKWGNLGILARIFSMVMEW